ncbi:ribonuclease G [Candidatus Fukatsuia symbiotica]|uniref:Ribonuclease G n=1 Tax=Candidatus Fukatsuia symbiotica TaxID=1878942 RepID=A0A2U8I4M3_9GAMM|nr:ribonuclease G [Candidatus Fukatsuia symbiotica]AWK14093.1 ribonuclease E/G [Candidatus Fukatsuia symbiotica]MEA9446140.1 ribonuclease G [Candidatus Fukatsuia symbiotica]
MTTELLVNITAYETRIAYIDDGIVQEIHIEREAKKGIVGNIYKGFVGRVLPGMQAAFVDIGLEKAGFLHASDIVSDTPYTAKDETKKIQNRDIAELVDSGKSLMVQVVKEPLGTKGARLTTDISLPSRYLVLMPKVAHVGVSRRIENEKERERLKSIITSHCGPVQGFIVRTAAENISEEELLADVIFLKRLWEKITKRKKNSTVKSDILYRELSLEQRILRDFAAAELDRILVDSKLTYDLLVKFTTEYIPAMVPKLEHYTGNQPLFARHNVEKEIQYSLDRKVVLRSGGYLVFDQTEAMTTIDINTGAFVGQRNLDETIFNTNIEATQVIARQLRLRNLGGIIIIDFIDMNSQEHRQKVLQALEQALSKDRVKTTFSDFSQLGLVEMTRKRTRESIEHVLCHHCPNCHGRGTIKSLETVCYEILREILRFRHDYPANDLLVCTSSAVSNALKNEESDVLAAIETVTGKPIKIQVEPLYRQEQFHLRCMSDKYSVAT